MIKKTHVTCDDKRSTIALYNDQFFIRGCVSLHALLSTNSKQKYENEP